MLHMLFVDCIVLWEEVTNKKMTFDKLACLTFYLTVSVNKINFHTGVEGL